MNELIVKPMLAQKVGVKEPTEEQWKEGLYLQPKLDGVRCLIQCNKENGKGVITAYSRTGKIWKNIDHILKEAIPFFRKYPNIVLDGELYNHNYRDNFEKIISLVRKTKPTDEDKLASKKAIKFYIYDVISPVGGLDNEPILGENSNDNYFRRCGFIRSNFNGAKAPNCFKVLNHELVYNEEQAKYAHERNLAKGFEGSILRINGRYEQKRSWFLQKYKEFSDAEATIIGYVEGKGKRYGTLGKFIMRDSEGIEFGCPPGKGYNYKDLTDMLKNIDNYIGKTATFYYFERTKANSYRHPLFKCIRDYE